MDLGSFLQLFFGMIATVTALLMILFKWGKIKACLRRFKNNTPLLPVAANVVRRANYIIELELRQNLMGDRAAEEVFEGPRIQRARNYRVSENN